MTTGRAEFLRPSAAATWLVCAGYAAMRAAYPDAPDEAENEVREDGIAAHWLAQCMWQGACPPEGHTAPNGRVITDEMFEAVDTYLQAIGKWPEPAVIEHQIPCDVILIGMKGTPDAYAYNARLHTLYIADLKFGFRFVEVWENWQLLVYVAALIEFLKLNDLNLIVEMTIVQPRSYHREGAVRTWRVMATDLRAYFNILRSAAEAAMVDVPPCTPNPGCTDCPARHACVALQHAALTALEVSKAGIPLELTPAAVGDELRRLTHAAKLLDARITGLEGQAESLIRSGSVVPGWGIVATYARERWRDGMESQVMTLAASYFGKPIAKPVQAMSPAQARKAGIPESVVSAFAHKPSTGVKLSPQDKFAARKAFQSQPQGK